MISQAPHAAAIWRTPGRRFSAYSFFSIAVAAMVLLFSAGSDARAAGENYISYFGADWGPDGDTIYFIKQIISTEKGDTQWQGCHFWFCKMKWDGTEKKEISELWPGQNAKIDLQGSPMWLQVNAATSNAAFGVKYGNNLGYGTWVVGLDGKNLHRPFEPIWNEKEKWTPIHPSWSPDGTKLVFEEIERTSPRARMQRLVVYDLKTKERKLLTEGPNDEHPAWSPKGDWIAFTHNLYDKGDKEYSDRRIWLIRSDGSEQRPVMDEKGKTICGWWPAWSPEGTKVSINGGILKIGSLLPTKTEWIDPMLTLGECSPYSFMAHHWGKRGWLLSVGPIRLINPDKKSARMLAEAGVYKVSNPKSEEACWGKAPHDIPPSAAMGSK